MYARFLLKIQLLSVRFCKQFSCCARAFTISYCTRHFAYYAADARALFKAIFSLKMDLISRVLGISLGNYGLIMQKIKALHHFNGGRDMNRNEFPVLSWAENGELGSEPCNFRLFMGKKLKISIWGCRQCFHCLRNVRGVMLKLLHYF